MDTYTRQPTTPEQLFTLLDSLNIKHETVTHRPVFTAHDAIDWQNTVPGLHCKNLFVESKSGACWLVTMPAADRADMNAIGKQLGSGRLSFCKPEKMVQVLGVTPGSATPLALINAAPSTISIALDKQVAEAPRLNVHPLHNAASTILSGPDLVRFIRHLGFQPTLIHTAGTQVFTAVQAI